MNSNRWISLDKKDQKSTKPIGSLSIKKIFPDMSKKVEPHVDEEQGVEYDQNGDTILLTKPNA